MPYVSSMARGYLGGGGRSLCHTCLAGGGGLCALPLLEEGLGPSPENLTHLYSLQGRTWAALAANL